MDTLGHLSAARTGSGVGRGEPDRMVVRAGVRQMAEGERPGVQPDDPDLAATLTAELLVGGDHSMLSSGPRRLPP